MFDFTQLAVGGVQVAALTFGMTQFFKELLRLEGQKVTVLAAVLGFIGVLSVQLIGIVPEPYGQIVAIVYNSLGGMLAAPGYYKFITRKDDNGATEGS